MNRLVPLYKATDALHNLLQKIGPSTQREEAIAEITSLLDEREQLLAQVKPPYSEEEQKLGRALLPLDQGIEKKLQTLFAELKSEMKAVKKQKTSNVKYTNPYQNVANFDGAFLDQKK
ncbi:hypothetical protein [Sediminibacillus massiliensis]|uniref:hypothetical protein n=1 Tax=Sediminibacillus massiliensis TaxID=1926277 RepID=UPI0009883720|nr:hypothetical protein [Sediminibacillus massiliensis]